MGVCLTLVSNEVLIAQNHHSYCQLQITSTHESRVRTRMLTFTRSLDFCPVSLILSRYPELMLLVHLNIERLNSVQKTWNTGSGSDTGCYSLHNVSTLRCYSNILWFMAMTKFCQPFLISGYMLQSMTSQTRPLNLLTRGLFANVVVSES